MGKQFVGEYIISGSSGGHYNGYVCTLEVEEMTGGDCGGSEDDGGDEIINSSDGDNDMFERNEEEKNDGLRHDLHN